jgi:hypothetical protein
MATPIDQGANGASVEGTLDEISFPVPGYLSPLSFSGSLAGGTHVSNAFPTSALWLRGRRFWCPCRRASMSAAFNGPPGWA